MGKSITIRKAFADDYFYYLRASGLSSKEIILHARDREEIKLAHKIWMENFQKYIVPFLTGEYTILLEINLKN